jgi:hypothetical protein
LVELVLVQVGSHARRILVVGKLAGGLMAELCERALDTRTFRGEELLCPLWIH